MREKFINGFVTKLYGEIPDEYLSVIRNKLSLYANNFDIQLRETGIVKYIGYLPDFYKTYIVSRKIEGLSQRTLEHYNLYLDDFFFTVNKRVEDITANDIRVYLYTTQESRGLSNRTLDSRRTAIHAFFEWAAGEGYVDKNPCRSIKNIKYERIQKKPLSDMELERVRQACKTTREKAMIEFLYSTGARVTEACTVKKQDVDFQNGEVIVLGKGNKHRKVYLNARSKLLLGQYLASRNDDSEYLFVSERKPHNVLKKEAIERIIRLIGERAELDRPLTPHLFRHTLATHLLQRGTPITEVQKILGHVNINTTTIYAKVADEDVKASHMKYAI
ncbi:MAG: Telomere resolvase [Bacteriophage sp.]|nr:MAG: Telomere resolvase [Bacteriophage sp.]